MTLYQRLRQNLNLWFCSIKVLRPYRPQSTPGAVLLGVAADGRFPSNVVVSDKNCINVLSKPGGLESIARSVMYAAFTKTNIPVYNAGMLDDIDGFDDLEIEDIQLEQYLKVLLYLMAGHFPITLGSSDFISIANYQALSAHLYQQQYHQHNRWYACEYDVGNNKIGIINFAPNFELRLTPSPKLDSGFNAVNQYCLETFRIFNYLGLGICKRTNSPDTFEYAKQLGCDWLIDKHMSAQHYGLIAEVLACFIKQVDHIHLSIDLAVIYHQLLLTENDSRHASQIQGITIEVLRFALSIIARSGKLKILDIVTLSPDLGLNDKTTSYVSSIMCTVLQNLKVPR
ncbi:MAG: arginase family protein [Moritella sp.]|uniref:arginase family protein n=1 Tax=Moritella sp. TaxID=78556 RepID=UPI001D53B7B2|nr:arginase family protein [Moritella sp.]NQZ50181.1 arginase family protein [Moritella sp.]